MDANCFARVCLLIAIAAWSLPTARAADPELNGQLIMALRRSDAGKVAELLKQGADPNAVDRPNSGLVPSGSVTVCSALREAVKHPKIVKILLAAGAKPDNEAMRQTGWLGDGESMRLMLDAGGSADAALRGASHAGYVDLVEFLLEKGANAKAKSRDGATALQLAALQGGFETVQLLLKAGADPNVADPRGETPLHAALHGDVEIDTVQALVKAGAKLDVADSRGQTPLRFAAAHGPREVYEYLLAANGGKEPRPASDPRSPASKKTAHALLQDLQTKDGGENQLQAYNELAARGEEIMPEALRSLAAGERFDLHCSLFSVLGPAAKSALPELVEYLGDKDKVFTVLMTMNVIEPGSFGKLPREKQSQAATSLYQATLNPPEEADFPPGYFVSALVDIGEPAIPQLLMLLRSKDDEHKRWAADALQGARFTSDEITDELIKLVRESGDTHVRKEAVKALGPQGRGKNPKVKAVLLEVMSQPWAEPVAPAGAPGFPSVPALTNSTWLDVAKTAALILSTFGPEVIDEMLPLVTPFDRPERLPAQRAIARMGEPAVPRLIELLGDEDPSVAQVATMALGEMPMYLQPKRIVRRSTGSGPPQPSSVATALCQALLSESDQVAENAATALRVGNARAALPELLVVAQDVHRSHSVRCSAACAALKIHAKDCRHDTAIIAAIPSLMNVLEKGSFSRQMDAAEALGKIGAPATGALPLLRQRLTLPDPAVDTGRIMRSALRDRAQLAIKAIESDKEGEEE